MNTDEILENLRLRALWATQEPIITLMTEAANEIERLRALADELHQRGMLQLKCTDKAWEAYAEVEADRDRWQTIADDFARWVSHQMKMEYSMWDTKRPYSHHELRKVLDRYNEAVRGE